jgi:surface carbohydrate biosynthesis protein
MKSSILFLVDHKHRDLQSLCLIGFFLKKKNWNIFYLPLDATDDQIEKINPNIITLPKPSYDLLRVFKWRNKNIKIIIIETEGNPQDLKYKARILIPIDFYFFWNRSVRDRYKNLLKARNIQNSILGFYRSDFLHESLSNLYESKKKILHSIGLNNENKTITIATSSQDSHFSEIRKQQKKKKRNRSLSETARYEDIVKNMIMLRDLTTNFVKEFAKTYPDINIVIKPHPHENVIFWDEFILKLSCSNVKLFVGKTINELLIISNFHISYNVCTTTSEAAVSGLPTMEINSSLSEYIYDYEHLSLPKYRANNIRDMTNFIIKELSSNFDNSIHYNYIKKVNKYIQKYFYNFDGKRCEAYANKINEYWNKVLEKKIATSRLPFYIKIMSKIYLIIKYLKSFLFSKKIEQINKLINEVNQPSEQNIRKFKKIGYKIIDYEYGLFDNRIKSGDEEYWLKKYDKLFFK